VTTHAPLRFSADHGSIGLSRPVLGDGDAPTSPVKIQGCTALDIGEEANRAEMATGRQHGPQVTPEVTIWEVYGEGSFRWRFSADYAESHIGAWAVSEVSPERGVMFLAGTSKEQRPPSRFFMCYLSNSLKRRAAGGRALSGGAFDSP